MAQADVVWVHLKLVAIPVNDSQPSLLVAANGDGSPKVAAVLEHFRFLCSEAVAAMPHVICTFVGHEEAQCSGHQFADVLERAGTGGA